MPKGLPFRAPFCHKDPVLSQNCLNWPDTLPNLLQAHMSYVSICLVDSSEGGKLCMRAVPERLASSHQVKRLVDPQGQQKCNVHTVMRTDLVGVPNKKPSD